MRLSSDFEGKHIRVIARGCSTNKMEGAKGSPSCWHPILAKACLLWGTALATTGRAAHDSCRLGHWGQRDLISGLGLFEKLGGTKGMEFLSVWGVGE